MHLDYRGEGSSDRNASRGESVETGDESVETWDESIEAGGKTEQSCYNLQQPMHYTYFYAPLEIFWNNNCQQRINEWGIRIITQPFNNLCCQCTWWERILIQILNAISSHITFQKYRDTRLNNESFGKLQPLELQLTHWPHGDMIVTFWV